MRRYGKKHDRCFDDKIARSNRGRARTSATGADRKHGILGYRCGHEQRVDLRSHKKRVRLSARLIIQDELLDLELSQSDPETWLHGVNLTTFADTVAVAKHRYYPSSFAEDRFTEDPYEYVPDAYDWDQDDEHEFRYLHVGDYESDCTWSSDWDSDPDPDPIDAAWRDLWVAGHAHDAEGRDLPDPMHDRYSSYDDTYDYDWLSELVNPLLDREDPASPATIEAIEERNVERRRAGERYFKQTGRTVFKPLDAPTRARLQLRGAS